MSRCAPATGRLDYRLGFTEPIMVHRLRRIPRFAPPTEIVRVLDPALANQVNTAVRRRQILPEHLTPGAPLRMYAALIDGDPVGWVSGIEVAGMTWCANLYVKLDFRRRGFGRALMCQMLRDDRRLRLAIGRAGCESHGGLAVSNRGIRADWHPAVVYAEPKVGAGGAG